MKAWIRIEQGKIRIWGLDTVTAGDFALTFGRHEKKWGVIFHRRKALKMAQEIEFESGKDLAFKLISLIREKTKLKFCPKCQRIVLAEISEVLCPHCGGELKEIEHGD